MMSEARAGSVRGPRQVTQMAPASSTTAAGSSQEISSPNSPLNRRCTPADPPKLLPAAPPPLMLPSPPNSRPSPLYPKASWSGLLSVDPPMYGRSAAGVRSTAAIHHPADTASAAPAASSCQARRQNGTGAATRYASPNAGTLSTASPLLVRNPNPNATPAPTSHRVRPCSRARVTQYAAI